MVKKKHNLLLERLEKAREKLNTYRIKRLYSMSERLQGKNEARAYINNADEGMLKYYHVFAK